MSFIPSWALAQYRYASLHMRFYGEGWATNQRELRRLSSLVIGWGVA